MIYDSIRFSSVCPLGEECYTAGSIDPKFNDCAFRTVAYPFDYVGHTFIGEIERKLKEIPDHAPLRREDVMLQLFNDRFYYVDRRFGFKYWHDVSFAEVSVEDERDREAFLERYNRRYGRLQGLITRGDKVLFLTVNHYDDIYRDRLKKEEIRSLARTIHDLNGNAYLLAVNFDDASYFDEDIHLYSVRIDHTRDADFQESKARFTEELRKYILNNIHNDAS